jgi:redox-sensing transcriptional repressor
VSRKVSDSAVRRLSSYLRILEQHAAGGGHTLSSVELARQSGTTAAQVRKDLSLFGSFGKRGTGYAVPELARELRQILGLGHTWRVALLGAGRIGSALFDYADFRARGFHIVAVLDNDPEKVGQPWGPVVIRHVDELEEVVKELAVETVILAVPAAAAPELARRATSAGVRGILNFAPVRLPLPEGVPVQNVNVVTELEALSYRMAHLNGVS